ncbi:conserved repeat protein (List_Bact_rpt) [Sphaerochaeta pleomorpha str. Grapes]|uniref:Conserved repeat protein (List_Bact_rpt) n=1 Tax=Sphaerochaeta pleomorpha (strain ATCC BAA-1885 / DSM 22778 / Grapes) TaxID=158190 RepID=G8QWX3_SPHPG|nr:InlB B-repeat-containing protein [Sphaerochaeta pleomorpha]AEV29477.1 conserved repeat protein (List_Bact_rpt) [Sphaerochaeta pleomorpha str. Grapes]
MTKKKITFVLLSCLIMLGLVVSCDPQALNVNQKGTLEISFNRFNSRGFYGPEIDMTVDHYVISGSGPVTATFGPVTTDGVSSETINDLIAGAWTITATAYNADDIAIGDGSMQVTIVAAHTTETTILVEEYDGSGTLSFTVVWPSTSNLADPHVTLTLTRNGSSSSSMLVTTVDASTYTATCSDNLPVGSYSLAVNLTDGAVSYNGPVHTIRIVKDVTTEGTYTFTSLSATPTEGNLRAAITNGIEDPFAVTLSRKAEQVAEGRYTRFTAAVPDSVDCEFAWYVDGVKLSNTGKVAFIGGNLAIGYHYIDVLASTQGLLTSASSTLSVVDAGEDEYMTFLLKGTDTPEQKPYYICFEAGPTGDWSALGISGVLDGSVYASKMNAPSVANQGTAFLAFDESMDTTTWNPEIGDPMLMLFIPQSAEGEFPAADFPEDFGTVPPNMLFQFIDASDPANPKQLNYLTNDSSNASIAVTLDSYGEVGERLIGSFVVDSAELVSPSMSRGNYSLECSFNVKRSSNIEFYTLSYDANGAEGIVPETYESPAAVEYQVGDDSSLVYAGYTFVEWNTASDGTGDAYESGAPFTIPDHDVTLYAIWEESIPR